MIRSGLAVAVGVAVLVFVALRAVPGDPAELMLGESASSASRAALRAELGLDQPLMRQFTHYFAGLARGNLGTSLTRHRPVARLIAETLPFTLLLAAAATVLANLVGIPAGALAAYRSRRLSGRAIFWLSIFASALPVFWLGPLLVIAFSLRWPWLPISGFHHLQGIVLPTIAIGAGLAAHVCQTTRAAVAETLGAEFIRTALAKGASERRALFFHVLPVAIRPVAAVSALQFGNLLAGAIVAETVFDWPGLGRLAHEALIQRDYPTVQGTVLVITLIYVGINTLTDLVLDRRPS